MVVGTVGSGKSTLIKLVANNGPWFIQEEVKPGSVHTSQKSDYFEADKNYYYGLLSSAFQNEEEKHKGNHKQQNKSKNQVESKLTPFQRDIINGNVNIEYSTQFEFYHGKVTALLLEPTIDELKQANNTSIVETVKSCFSKRFIITVNLNKSDDEQALIDSINTPIDAINQYLIKSMQVVPSAVMVGMYSSDKEEQPPKLSNKVEALIKSKGIPFITLNINQKTNSGSIEQLRRVLMISIDMDYEEEMGDEEAFIEDAFTDPSNQ